VASGNALIFLKDFLNGIAGKGEEESIGVIWRGGAGLG
jgi:hypothetical protein